jgi:signal transduction histidine kinase
MEAENDEQRQKEYINIINKSSLSAHNLIDRVLEMDAMGHENFDVHMKPIDICATLSEVIDNMNESARKKQTKIVTLYESPSCLIMGDTTYLIQIFENLISNAIKFSEEGKKIQVEVANIDSNVRVKIIDEGPGINPEEEDKLFKKFSKLSSRPTAGESSTGLGLSLVKKYVELIGGRVWYERESGMGATFVVELPLAD